MPDCRSLWGFASVLRFVINVEGVDLLRGGRHAPRPTT